MSPSTPIRVLLATAILLLGCGAEVEIEPDIVATFAGNSLHFTDVRKRLPPTAVLGGSEDLVLQFESAAKAMAIRSIVLEDRRAEPAASDIDTELVVDLYLARQPELRFVLDEDEIQAAFETDRERFVQTDRADVYHLYRNHERPDEPSPTLELLSELRAQALNGTVSFSQIARQYSESETRALGGHLGWVPRGRLPPALDRVVFALEPGEISKPIPTSGGAMLVHVADRQRHKQFEFEEVRPHLQTRLSADRSRTLLEDHLRDTTLPEDSLLLSDQELADHVTAGSEELCLVVADIRKTCAELRSEFEARLERASTTPWPVDQDWILEDVYAKTRLRALAYLKAQRSGFTLLPEVSEHLQTLAQMQQEQAIVEEFVQEAIALRAAEQNDRLRSYFNDHQHKYQTELSLHLRSLSLPLGAQPNRTLITLDQAATQIQLESKTPEAVAEELGARLEDHGYLTGDELDRLEGKVRFMVLSLQGEGTTSAFQLNRQLSVVTVEDWIEPRPLTYEESIDRVLEDFVATHQQDLYQEVTDALLETADFRFYEDHVRSNLDANL